MKDPLIIGEYYWVLIALDVDAELEWENEPMPARYGGEQNGEQLWFTINGAGDDSWPVRWVGERIPKPNR